VTTLPLDLEAFAGLPAIEDGAVSHGEVFTRAWVVETILDLVGWRAERDLATTRLVEPACGAGAFLSVIARRASESCRRFGRPLIDVAASVRAVDLLPAHVAKSRRVVTEVLVADGWDTETAQSVAEAWVGRGDYLLSQPDNTDVDIVVGNPPYIRMEDLPEARMKVYRSLWPTMIGRADVYVGFIEAGLRSLRAGGALGYICADRWMRNHYGRALRELVAEDFAVEAVINMHDVEAFEETVSAYPAIVVLRRGVQFDAVVADTTARFGETGAAELVNWVRRGRGSEAAGRGWRAARAPQWHRGSPPWPAAPPRSLLRSRTWGNDSLRSVNALAVSHSASVWRPEPTGSSSPVTVSWWRRIGCCRSPWRPTPRPGSTSGPAGTW
jgi:adenine-specific DNA-methyltransferase